MAPGGEAAAEKWDEPRRKGAFREQPAEDVGKQEGQVERVVGVARAQHARTDHVTRKSEHSADHCQAADRADRPIEIHLAVAALRVADRRLTVAPWLALGCLL